MPSSTIICALLSGSSKPRPMVVPLLIHTAVNQHHIFPFHNLAILVEEGEQTGRSGSTGVIKSGIPLTVPVSW